MAIVISGVNNNDKITASDGTIDLLSGVNFNSELTVPSFKVGNNIQIGNAGIITATTYIGNLTGNVNATSNLLLQIGGSEKFRVGGSGQLGIGGANYGTSGQVLTSGGSGSAATWSTISGTTINNNANNRVITGSGTANTLNGEANLTFDGTEFKIPTGASTQGLFFQASSGANANLRGVGSNYGELGFFIGNSELARLKGNGHVGIGTDNPQTLLHLKSDDPTLRIQRHNQSAYGEITVDTAGKIILKSDPGDAAQPSGFSFTVNNSEKVGISSAGNLVQTLTSTGTSPFQDSHWYDQGGGHYTLTTTDHDSMTAVRSSSGGVYSNLVYKRVKMSKNCDIEFDLKGNSPAGIYRHVGFVINGNGTAATYDRLVFRSRPANTANNTIRLDRIDGSGNFINYGFNYESSDIPTFFDGTERHILIQLRGKLFNVLVDGVVILSQETNNDLQNSSGWFGFGIYEGGESAQITIRNLTIKNKFIQPHWIVKGTGINVDVNEGNAIPFNSVMKSSSDMSNSSHYNNGSYRFNVPISGVYYVFFRIYRNSSTSGEIGIYVDGNLRQRFRPLPNSGDYIFAGSSLIELTKGNYIDVRPYNGNLDNFYGNSSEPHSSWGGHLID